jgi:peptidyl-prolyl cis-trans isomerase D
VKAELEKEVKGQLASKRYNEAVDTFNNTVYEQADSLQPVADKLKLTVQTADGVTRQPNPAFGKDNPLNNDKVLKAIFSDDVLKNKRNTEAVQVGTNALIAARVVEYRPQTVRKFDEVQDLVRAKVVAQQSTALAKKAGEAKLAALKAAPGGDGFGPTRTVSRAKAEGLAPKAVEALMRADAGKLPAIVGVDLGADGYAVYRITKVTVPPVTDPARQQADAQQLAQVAGQNQLGAYFQSLKARSNVKLLKPAAASAPAAS